jgi:hypothetical protein
MGYRQPKYIGDVNPLYGLGADFPTTGFIANRTSSLRVP